MVKKSVFFATAAVLAAIAVVSVAAFAFQLDRIQQHQLSRAMAAATSPANLDCVSLSSAPEKGC